MLKEDRAFVVTIGGEEAIERYKKKICEDFLHEIEKYNPSIANEDIKKEFVKLKNRLKPNKVAPTVSVLTAFITPLWSFFDTSTSIKSRFIVVAILVAFVVYILPLLINIIARVDFSTDTGLDKCFEFDNCEDLINYVRCFTKDLGEFNFVIERFNQQAAYLRLFKDKTYKSRVVERHDDGCISVIGWDGFYHNIFDNDFQKMRAKPGKLKGYPYCIVCRPDELSFDFLYEGESQYG